MAYITLEKPVAVELWWERIKRMMLDMDWSPEDLAQRAGLTASYVYGIVRGERKAPSYDTVRRLAGAFNLKPDELMGGPDDDNRVAGVPYVKYGPKAHILDDVGANLLKIEELDEEEYDSLVRLIEERRRKLERDRKAGR